MRLGDFEVDNAANDYAGGDAKAIAHHVGRCHHINRVKASCRSVVYYEQASGPAFSCDWNARIKQLSRESDPDLFPPGAKKVYTYKVKRLSCHA